MKFKDAIRVTPRQGQVLRISVTDFKKEPERYFRAGWPFIVTDMLHYLGSEETILSRLTKDFGHMMIYARSKHGDERKITIAEYIEIIRSNDDLQYAANNILSTKMKEGLPIEQPPGFACRNFETPRLWIGAQGTTTFLHRDSSDNFSYQLIGTKRWKVFPIHENDKLYFQNSKSDFAKSLIDLKQVDIQKYPLFQEAIAIDIIVEPMEVFYLPYGWGHFVENLSLSVMVNFWFKAFRYKPLVLVARQDVR